jgi:hypothetical protein
VLFIVRGLPGSGKSSLAKHLAPAHAQFSADDFFIRDGLYSFDRSKLPDAYAQCQLRAAEGLCKSRDLGYPYAVAVANTFVASWEIYPYIRIAADIGSEITIISLFDAGLSDADLSARCVHGVPEAVIASMRARYVHALNIRDMLLAPPEEPWRR